MGLRNHPRLFPRPRLVICQCRYHSTASLQRPPPIPHAVRRAGTSGMITGVARSDVAPLCPYLRLRRAHSSSPFGDRLLHAAITYPYAGATVPANPHDTPPLVPFTVAVLLQLCPRLLLSTPPPLPCPPLPPMPPSPLNGGGSGDWCGAECGGRSTGRRRFGHGGGSRSTPSRGGSSAFAARYSGNTTSSGESSSGRGNKILMGCLR